MGGGGRLLLLLLGGGHHHHHGYWLVGVGIHHVILLLLPWLLLLGGDTPAGRRSNPETGTAGGGTLVPVVAVARCPSGLGSGGSMRPAAAEGDTLGESRGVTPR